MTAAQRSKGSTGEFAVGVAKGAARNRLTGTAAEMAFFAVIALVPLTLAFGAALGYVGRLVGPERVQEGQDTVIEVMRVLLGPESTADTIDPLVTLLLVQERGGLALSGLLLALWLGSRVFVPALDAVARSYGSPRPRSVPRQRLIGMGLAVVSLIASVLTLLVMIIGPLVGGVQRIATMLELGTFFRVAWSVGRWPALFAILVAFLTVFYRIAPGFKQRWRDLLPGAVVGVGLWVVVALAFRLYLALGGQPGGGVPVQDEALVAVSRTVAAILATMLWTFLSSLVILLGGEINAQLYRRRNGGLPGDDG